MVDKEGRAEYVALVSVAAMQILEQFRKLSLSERRELCEAILRESVQLNSSGGQKRIADIAGKYIPRPDVDAKMHDREFAEAVLASKRDADEP